MIFGLVLLPFMTPDLVTAQIREQSVQLPDQIEQDIRSLNHLIMEFDNESITVNQTVEKLVSDFQEQITLLKSNNLSSLEQQRVAEKAANIRAQIQKLQFDYLSKVNTISGKILGFTDRLENTDLSIHELESVRDDFVQDLSERLFMIEARMIRGSILAEYGNISEDISANIDELAFQYNSTWEMGNQQLEYAKMRTEKMIGYVENFGYSIRDHTSYIGSQAELMKVNSGMLLERVRFNAQSEIIAREIFKPIETLEELSIQLKDLTGNFNFMEQPIIETLSPESPINEGSTIIDEVLFGRKFESMSGINNQSSTRSRSNADIREIHARNLSRIRNN